MEERDEIVSQEISKQQQMRKSTPTDNMWNRSKNDARAFASVFSLTLTSNCTNSHMRLLPLNDDNDEE